MSQEGSKENVLSTTSSAGIRRNSLPLDRTQSDHVDNYYENLDPDKLMNEYGFGRYQWFTYVLCEGMNFFYSSAMYVMPYVGLNPKLECTYKNESVVVDENSSTTLITEFGITCSSFFWKEAGLTSFTVGAIFLVPILSTFADEYGRRPLVVICLFTAFLSNVLASVAPNYYVFIFLRLIVGAASDTYYSLCSILACELLPSKDRAWITLVETIAWVLGMFWVGILSLYIHQWRWMYFACTAPGILAIFYYFFLPESPHWLIQHMDYRRIELFIKTSNKWNNVAVDVNCCRRDGPVPVEKRETCGEILKSPEMLKLLFINGFVQFIMAFYYFGLSLLSVDLSSDRFTAYMLSAFVELPGGLALIPLMLYTGRRALCVSTLALQGLFVIIAPFLKEPHWFMVACFLCGKFINRLVLSSRIFSG
ncbi:MFS domain-containing protein [Trichostrongylus colubriformis]|uniref:MFS domain-containing protein n=1 Tax=Trichostrongylus colubriformis TaxID=6319 RepID=A0AAN8FWI5_TRICO